MYSWCEFVREGAYLDVYNVLLFFVMVSTSLFKYLGIYFRRNGPPLTFAHAITTFKSRLL